MSTSADGVHVRELLKTAERAESSGNQSEADQALSRAQTAAPDNVLVLNALGMRSFRKGDATTAQKFLKRVVAAEPKIPDFWLNLALIHRAGADPEAERNALEKALALDPYFFLALLQKATLLERQGRTRQAASAFQAFLACLPSSVEQSSAMQRAVAHARKAIAENNSTLEVFLNGKISTAHATYETAKQDRFNHCLDALLGKRRIYVQQPTLMHFPGLPAIEFYERSEFPWLNAIESATDEIRRELVSVLEEQSGSEFEPYVAYPEGTPLNQWKELNHSRRWSAFYLLRNGERIQKHLERCPRTAEVLAAAPLADVPSNAPTAFFSLLEPRTRIPPHTGVTNTRLTVHLPLVIPVGCGFRVGSETREWVSGKAWVFDDTIEHEAWNDSDEWRVVLIFDIWNPYLTLAECDLVRTATQGLAEYYGQ